VEHADKNEDGNLYYLIEDLEDIEIGEEFYVEAFKLKNGKYGKRISKVAVQASAEHIPTIQLDEQDGEGDRPSLGGERIFRSTIYPSKRDQSVVYTTTIYWGGSMMNPNITCTCPWPRSNESVAGTRRRCGASSASSRRTTLSTTTR